MAKSRITLKDLSQRTGFDKSTISRVLRDDETLSIRRENIELIKAAAREMNYIPDAAGRRLRSSRSYSIGALVSSLQNQIHAQIIEGAAESCRKRGYSLIIAQAENGPLQLDVIRDMIKRNSVDGLLALTFRSEYSHLNTDGFNVPVVAVNWRDPTFKSWVTVDERPGARMITQHLIDLGHRRIAHISGDPKRFNARERLAGYREALEGAGIAYDPEIVERGDYSFDKGFQAMNTLLDRKQSGFTAVFVVSMLSAAGAINALHQRGIVVPQQLSVVGFHDGMLAQAITPSLTTVAYPLMQVGEAAATGLMDMLDNKAGPFTRVVGNPQLVVRNSSGVAP